MVSYICNLDFLFEFPFKASFFTFNIPLSRSYISKNVQALKAKHKSIKCKIQTRNYISQIARNFMTLWSTFSGHSRGLRLWNQTQGDNPFLIIRIKSRFKTPSNHSRKKKSFKNANIHSTLNGHSQSEQKLVINTTAASSTYITSVS